MAQDATPQRLSDLEKLTSATSIYTPLSHAAESPTILLHTWMNAAPAHIIYYFRNWHELLPDARIIIVQGTVPDIVYRTAATQKRGLGPVLSALRAEPNSPLYMHLFSNAGANSAAILSRAFKETSTNGDVVLPLRGLLLDSAPSRGSYEAAYAGMVYQVPRHPFPLHYLGVALTHALVVVAFLLEALTGKPNTLSQSSSDLNDSSLLPAGISRVYLYSKEDLLVGWEDVEYHAAIAESRGWAVTRAAFQGTDHCRHGKGRDEARYWKFVHDLVSSTSED